MTAEEIMRLVVTLGVPAGIALLWRVSMQVGQMNVRLNAVVQDVERLKAKESRV